MLEAEPYTALTLSVGLGLLVGLEREWAADEIAGIRTFPMICLLGALSALLGPPGSVAWVAVAMVGLASFLVVGNVALIRGGTPSPGMTTESAALVMFFVGVAVAQGFTLPAVVVTGTVTVLLHWKGRLSALVDGMGADEAAAIFRWVLIALVVLPVLPDTTYGPYDVLNPFRIWLMVVLIVGISLVAYAAYRIFGSRAGTLLAGVLGGLISSTATTVSYAQQTRASGLSAPVAAVVIMIASTVVFARVLVEIAVVHAAFLAQAGPPIVAMMVAMLLIAARAYWVSRRERVSAPDGGPPADLKAALVFGLLYGVILFVVAWAKETLGDQALYGVAALSGLTDVDAITLSVTELVQLGRVDAGTGWRLILVGVLSNLVFKGGAVVALGSRALRGRMLRMFGLSLAAGILILVLWGSGSGLVS